MRVAFEAQRRPADYIDAVNEHGVGWISEERLTGEETADELLIMGLRTNEGVDLERFGSLRERPANVEALAWLAEQGLVTRANQRVTLTPRGRALANRIALEIAA